jgi:hypothetical protein
VVAFAIELTFNKQQGAQSFSCRVMSQSVPNLNDLELPSSIADLAKHPRELVLVTDASGRGKSTTASALLQQLNETMALRVITIEDRTEYRFLEHQSQFEQRKVGVDTASLLRASAMPSDKIPRSSSFVRRIELPDAIYGLRRRIRMKSCQHFHECAIFSAPEGSLF